MAYVNKGKEAQIWKDWNDYDMSITPRDNEDPGVQEGMEAQRPLADCSDDDRYTDLDEVDEEEMERLRIEEEEAEAYYAAKEMERVMAIAKVKDQAVPAATTSARIHRIRRQARTPSHQATRAMQEGREVEGAIARHRS